MNEYGMNEFEMIKKADVMRIINAENAVVLNNMKERSTDEVLCAIASQINSLQTTEGRHGEWVEGTSRGSFSIYCSYCGSHKETICPSDYCPNCGARMDGGSDNG